MTSFIIKAKKKEKETTAKSLSWGECLYISQFFTSCLSQMGFFLQVSTSTMCHVKLAAVLIWSRRCHYRESALTSDRRGNIYRKHFADIWYLLSPWDPILISLSVRILKNNLDLVLRWAALCSIIYFRLFFKIPSCTFWTNWTKVCCSCLLSVSVSLLFLYFILHS